MKRLGAAEVLDYKSEDVVSQLRSHGPFKYLFTASGDQASQRALAELLQPTGGTYASVLGGDVSFPDNVTRVYLPFTIAAQKDENAEFRKWWYGEYLPEVLDEGLVEAVPIEKRNGGLGALQIASGDVLKGIVKGKNSCQSSRIGTWIGLWKSVTSQPEGNRIVWAESRVFILSARKKWLQQSGYEAMHLRPSSKMRTIAEHASMGVSCKKMNPKGSSKVRGNIKEK